MEEKVTAAITAAINAYIQEEETLAALSKVKPYPEIISPWRIFGRQKLMTTRTHWQTRRLRK